jgi:hypothetical protein
LKTAAGNPIGTIFVMSHRPSSGLDAARQQVLTGTASNVMRQLTLILQALEGERLMQFQSATAALLQRERPSLYQQANVLPREQPGVIQQSSHIVEVYQHAAEVMRQSLKLEGVLFQYVPSDNQTPQATPGNWQDSTLATLLNVESSRPICLSSFELDKIIQTFPHGAVLHHLDGDWLMSTFGGKSTFAGSGDQRRPRQVIPELTAITSHAPFRRTSQPYCCYLFRLAQRLFKDVFREK